MGKIFDKKVRMTIDTRVMNYCNRNMEKKLCLKI
jgi:hypothetical protein